MVTNTT